jgi:hypothetical protein
MAEHMEFDELHPDRVCAVAVRLIDATWFRVGSERHAANGVTPLRERDRGRQGAAPRAEVLRRENLAHVLLDVGVQELAQVDEVPVALVTDEAPTAPERYLPLCQRVVAAVILRQSAGPRTCRLR